MSCNESRPNRRRQSRIELELKSKEISRFSLALGKRSGLRPIHRSKAWDSKQRSRVIFSFSTSVDRTVLFCASVLSPMQVKVNRSYHAGFRLVSDRLSPQLELYLRNGKPIIIYLPEIEELWRGSTLR